MVRLDNANKTLILSLGGSVIVPDSVDINFLKNFKSLILSYIGLGFHFVIVCGGGKVCRDYQAAACNISPLSKVDLDWLGIAATKLNAELVRSIFGELAYEKVVNNPKKKINTDKQIIIACTFFNDSAIIVLSVTSPSIISTLLPSIFLADAALRLTTFTGWPFSNSFSVIFRP